MFIDQFQSYNEIKIKVLIGIFFKIIVVAFYIGRTVVNLKNSSKSNCCGIWVNEETLPSVEIDSDNRLVYLLSVSTSGGSKRPTLKPDLITFCFQSIC